MPNSIVQGLTTTTQTGLNRLTAFQMVTLFGLVAHISSKHPHREVRLKPRDILEIIRVGKTVNHAVERTWMTQEGERRTRRYRGSRYSPRHWDRVHDALLVLFDTAVVVRQRDGTAEGRIRERVVHILDSFGYVFELDGEPVDVDDLPAGRTKENVAKGDRPVWRIRRQAGDGERYERPVGIVFRLNTELANELASRKGTIAFTIFAHRVFDLFRALMATPAAIRLLVLVLRQTQDAFTRPLTALLNDLGWDVTHPARAITQLTDLLGRLRRDEVVTDYTVDRGSDRVRITVNRTWHKTDEAVF